jgi:hypothetical protein
MKRRRGETQEKGQKGKNREEQTQGKRQRGTDKGGEREDPR